MSGTVVADDNLNSIAQFLKTTSGILFFSMILIVTEACLGPLYNHFIGIFDPTKMGVLIYFVIYSLIVFFVFPVLVSQFALKQTLKEIGLAWPTHIILAGFLILLFLLILIPYMVHFSTLTSFQGYTLGHPKQWQMAIIMGLFFPLYYLAEEFFFRGFLFINLWNKVRWHSFWITDIIFTVAHLGKPPLEIILCIPVSIMFNVLTLSTKSILPAFIVHTTMGITLSLLVTFK